MSLPQTQDKPVNYVTSVPQKEITERRRKLRENVLNRLHQNRKQLKSSNKA